VLRRAVALATGATLETHDLFPDSTVESELDKPCSPRSLSDHLETSERTFLVATLQELGGAVGEAANRLGISRKTLWEKMKRHGIDRQQLRAAAEQEALR
jgi:transcriptional regulator of acetoin/glycerol metabolism